MFKSFDMFLIPLNSISILCILRFPANSSIEEISGISKPLSGLTYYWGPWKNIAPLSFIGWNSSKWIHFFFYSLLTWTDLDNSKMRPAAFLHVQQVKVGYEINTVWILFAYFLIILAEMCLASKCTGYTLVFIFRILAPFVLLGEKPGINRLFWM